MAFQQPSRQAFQRITRRETVIRESEDFTPQVFAGPDESQTWVLFSPPTDAGTTVSYFSSVQESQPTAGRSRFSDLGSLNTVARSEVRSQAHLTGVPSVFAEQSTAEEDAELDSLDSHLPDFRSTPTSYHHVSQHVGLAHTRPVLPGHDGFGSFRVEAEGVTADIQEQLYAFEQFNPRRIKRRRESYERTQQLFEEEEEVREVDRNRRIEEWRLEQSHLLLEEIRKETRRRRQSEASISKLRAEKNVAEEVATMSTVDEGGTDDNFLGNGSWHDQDIQPGLWSQFGRKVVRDLMGIDERLLSILFGEILPDDEDLSSTPKASDMRCNPAAAPAVESESSYESPWQVQLLERVARELGSLVNHLSSHPGAFSSYKQMQHMPIPYAGLPVIPEMTGDNNGLFNQKPDDNLSSVIQFQPTVPHQTQPVDIPGAQSHSILVDSAHTIFGEPNHPTHAFTQQEWEQDLDIRLVFRYLRSRFTSGRSASTPFTTGTSHLATSSTQDAAAKAARVRQHHPLVSHAHQRPRPVERRSFKVATPGSPVGLRHASGSCASQSTRRSARRSSISSRHSSRHFWDIGGSIGTGSIIASAGPMGSWGEA